MTKTIVILGGGAAGFFAAINCKEQNPALDVILLEKSAKPLAKVAISGGGRCNVTHACFDPKQLISFYPRGGKALLGPFHHFGPQDTVKWFERRGVMLKTEEDGRMFPITDSSETVINCLQNAAKTAGVDIRTQTNCSSITKTKTDFILEIDNKEAIACDKLLIATGSSRPIFDAIIKLGHTIIEPVPSLFTFNIPNSPLHELSGITVEHVIASIVSLTQEGPLLITHFGFSGPAILKLSAWGARALATCQYNATLHINWTGIKDRPQVEKALLHSRQTMPQKEIGSTPLFNLAKNLWKKLILLASLKETLLWAHLSNQQLKTLLEKLTNDPYEVQGKTTYKQEFVTAGGVAIDEVNFKTMESKKVKGLYFAGEVLDIDGVTGGFNFQNAWTTAWLASMHLSSSTT